MTDKPQREWTVTDEGLARVYKVRATGGFGWAIVTIREWERGGQLDVQSDYGPFSYIWTAIGPRTLRQFLCGLDIDYFMGKARHGGWREFDAEATALHLKSDVVRVRREQRFTKDEARECFEDIEAALADYDCDERGFANEIMRSAWSEKIVDGYPPIMSRTKPECQAFWDGPWQALCDHWKSETAAVAA